MNEKQIAPADHQQPVRPTIGHIDADGRRDWARVADKQINQWLMTTHEDWLRPVGKGKLSRVVLVAAVFQVTFTYPTGNAEARRCAEEEAIAFATRNTVRRKFLGLYTFWIAVDMVAFTGVFKPAGWLTGVVAQFVIRHIADSDRMTLDGFLDQLRGYIPKDWTADLAELIPDLQAKPLTEDERFGATCAIQTKLNERASVIDTALREMGFSYDASVNRYSRDGVNVWHHSGDPYIQRRLDLLKPVSTYTIKTVATCHTDVTDRLDVEMSVVIDEILKAVAERVPETVPVQ